MALWRLLGYQGGWIWEKLGPPLKQAQTCIAPLKNPRWTVRSCCCCFRTRSWMGVSERRGGSVARQLLAKLSRGGGAAWRPSDASRGGGVASMWQPGARGGVSRCGPGSGAALRFSQASFGGAVERPWLVSVSRRDVHRNMNEAEGLRQRRPVRPQVLTEENAAQAVKDSSTYSNRVFRVTFMTLAVLLIIPLFGALIFLDCPIDPQPISFKEPPPLTGALEPNVKLRQAERLFENQLIGPESITNIGDVLFTGTADGKIVKIENGKISTLARLGHGPCGTKEDEPTCGRPLGIRVGPNNTLFVLDAYYGLFEINPDSGAVRPLVSSKIPIEGKNMSFVNDLTMTRDGRKIYFTDSSSKWQRKDYSLLIMEATDDGRLFEYDTVTKEVKVLMEGLRFPNGVQLSPAEDFVLVAETVMARIRRYYVSGLMKGGEDLFVENMPGFPDNIRLSSSGGYWVAMSAIRANPGFSMVDFLSEKPWIKRIILKLLSQETVIKFVPKYSLVVELSDTGSYRRSFHDPNGMVATHISEAHEYNGHLYLGSFQSPFICRLDLKDV